MELFPFQKHFLNDSHNPSVISSFHTFFVFVLFNYHVTNKKQTPENMVKQYRMSDELSKSSSLALAIKMWNWTTFILGSLLSVNFCILYLQKWHV